MGVKAKIISKNPNGFKKVIKSYETQLKNLCNIAVNLDKRNLAVDVESKADYSIHLEFGTQNMKARPFMFPALEENKPKIRRMFANIKGKPK